MKTSNFKTAGHLPNAVAISQGVPRLLTMAFKKSVRRLRESLQQGMPIDLWNESVFRFTYCQALNAPKSVLGLFGECERIDLVLHRHDKLAAAVEFKFYPRRSRYDLHGERRGFKGGPGSKNKREFAKSAKKLRHCAPPNVLKLIALVYADPHNSTGRKRGSFEASFGSNSGIERKLNLRRLVSIDWLLSDGCRCSARLFQVR